MEKIAIGISSCLLGQEVRYNGGHKLSRLCVNKLSGYFTYKAVCPEVGIGLGVPRTPIHLVGDAENPRAVNVQDNSMDLTERLQNFAKTTLPELQNICGYIFIKGSPSCGLFRVKVYREGNPGQVDHGRGIYARAVTDAIPLLPVEEAGRLTDPVLQENFIARVYAYHRWQKLCAGGLSAAGILDFHAAYKYSLMAHAPQSYVALGRMLADAGRHDPERLGQEYFAALMQALARSQAGFLRSLPGGTESA